RNNILWVQAGYDLNVAADSQQGLNSDYNDLYKTASGQVVLWGSSSLAQLVDWQYQLNLDRHGLSVDPQFVNPAGNDGFLGYDSVHGGDHGQDDNFQILAGSPT